MNAVTAFSMSPCSYSAEIRAESSRPVIANAGFRIIGARTHRSPPRRMERRRSHRTAQPWDQMAWTLFDEAEGGEHAGGEARQRHQRTVDDCRLATAWDSSGRSWEIAGASHGPSPFDQRKQAFNPG